MPTPKPSHTPATSSAVHVDAKGPGVDVRRVADRLRPAPGGGSRIGTGGALGGRMYGGYGRAVGPRGSLIATCSKCLAAKCAGNNQLAVRQLALCSGRSTAVAPLEVEVADREVEPARLVGCALDRGRCRRRRRSWCK